MRFIFELGNKILQMVQGLRISSANPLHINEVLGGAHLNIAGLTEAMQQDVIQIIQDEIKIQMTTFQEEPPNPKSKPAPSTQTKVQNEISDVMGIIKNPGQFVATGLRVLPPVAAALFAKQIADYILTELTSEGGPLDTRWKRQLDKEQNAFLDRQQQRNTQIGLRQVITTSKKGFIKLNGAGGTESNIRQIRDGGVDGNRLARVDILDHTKGLFGN